MEEAGVRLEKEYVKDRKSNYLVLKGRGDERSYKNKMLSQYTIPGLLRTEIRSIDNIELFYYDVTDLKTVETAYKDKVFHFSEVKSLLREIFQIVDSSMEYFLEQDDFLLQPEYLFLRKGPEDLQLCYFPGYDENIVNQLAVLFEFIMNKAEYKEEPLVLLIYALYKESRERSTTLQKLKDILKEYDHQEIKVKKVLPTLEVENLENDTAVKRETDKVVDKKPGGFIKEAGARLKKNDDRTETAVNLAGEYEKQEEVSYYEVQTYIIGGAAAAVGIGVLFILYKNGILSNGMGEPDAVKVAAGIAVIVCLVGYVFSRLFDPKMKSTKMVTTLMYEEDKPASNKVDIRGNKTALRENEMDVRGNKTALRENEMDNRGNRTALRESKMDNRGNRMALRENEMDNRENRTALRENKMVYRENKDRELKSGNPVSTVKEDAVYEIDEFATQILEEEGKTEILFAVPVGVPYFLIAKDTENPWDIPIKDFPFYIGKDKSRNQLVLKEGSVSRLHAVLTIRGQEVFLTDLDSTNGTYVNGQKVEKNQPVPINNSDELAFSREVYLFKVKEF